MRAVIQRVSRASVEVRAPGTCTPEGSVVPEAGAMTIGAGLLVLVGVAVEDEAADAQRLASKVARLRIFESADGRMNESLLDRGASLLAVPQFTLLADTRKGNRPSFGGAAAPDHAIPLFDAFVEAARAQGLDVKTGVFGADMRVELTNEGPVTLLLDTRRP